MQKALNTERMVNSEAKQVAEANGTERAKNAYENESDVIDLNKVSHSVEIKDEVREEENTEKENRIS